MPGFLVGANEFQIFGKQLVYMAKTQKNANIEVWAVERRPNCIENLTGLEAAEAAADPQIAIDYYWYGKEINGRAVTVNEARPPRNDFQRPRHGGSDYRRDRGGDRKRRF